ncbi:MAG: class I SAM-dependent methyltransferase [Actinomycetia bacterium]|nr:class I SAM-dependent methyltransferase [Actinomycetes bacterium]MCP4959562.1 class I SAM-dependent methyltransferase [Actinomycetes bacterium]
MAARRYHLARPQYPAVLFDALHEMAGLIGPADVLEVGPATGVATTPMAERGHRITAVELGADLAVEARRNLASFKEVSVEHASFDSWEPERWGSFDLVFAATAWHWMDPGTKYQRARRHLRPGGVLAFWSAGHVVPQGGDPFFADIQDVYDEIGESLSDSHRFPTPGEMPDLSGEVAASEGLEMIGVRHFDWEITYDANAYVALLETFSDHIAIDGWKRDRLFGEIRRRLAERPDGLLRRHWGAALHAARRDPPD